MTAVATAEVLVDAAPADAFRIFTDEIGLWWRRDTPYWNDRERGQSIRIEPGVGGRFIEVYDLDSGEGMEVGRVTVWEPGRRLGLTWTQRGWPAGVRTNVTVSFEPLDNRTRVRLEHSGFEQMPDGDELRAGYDGGWKEVLGWFAQHFDDANTERNAHE
jgi:hypothetical protein